jgi:hypothetical protein
MAGTTLGGFMLDLRHEGTKIPKPVLEACFELDEHLELVEMLEQADEMWVSYKVCDV